MKKSKNTTAEKATAINKTLQSVASNPLFIYAVIGVLIYVLGRKVFKMLANDLNPFKMSTGEVEAANAAINDNLPFSKGFYKSRPVQNRLRSRINKIIGIINSQGIPASLQGIAKGLTVEAQATAWANFEQVQGFKKNDQLQYINFVHKWLFIGKASAQNQLLIMEIFNKLETQYLCSYYAKLYFDETKKELFYTLYKVLNAQNLATLKTRILNKPVIKNIN